MESFGWQLSPASTGMAGWEMAGAHLALEPEMGRAWGVCGRVDCWKILGFSVGFLLVLSLGDSPLEDVLR